MNWKRLIPHKHDWEILTIDQKSQYFRCRFCQKIKVICMKHNLVMDEVRDWDCSECCHERHFEEKRADEFMEKYWTKERLRKLEEELKKKRTVKKQ